MIITLNPDQEARLETRAESGDFASVEEAARQVIDAAWAERALEESDDMAWRSAMSTKPWPRSSGAK